MKITVIIPLYNKAKWINRAIDSVLDQTFQDFEIIVVNDGSTDGSDLIVENITDVRVKVIHQKNSGASAARNTGIQSAKGEWIAFLDSDDEWLSQHLETFQRLVSKFPDVFFAGASYAKQKPDGKWFSQILPESFGTGEDLLIEDSLSLLTTQYKHFFCTDTIFIKRCVFEDVGLFDTQLTAGEDTDMWFRVALKCRQMAYSRKIVAIYYDIPLSLVKCSDVTFNTSQSLIEKYLSVIQSIPPSRQEKVYRIIRSRIHMLIISLVFSGQKAKAVELSYKYKNLILPPKLRLYWLYFKLPVFLLRLFLLIKLMFSKFLKRKERKNFYCKLKNG